MFTSGFSEGTSRTSSHTSNNTIATLIPTSIEQDPEETFHGRIVEVYDNYEIFKNILYFLYTGIVIFDTDPETSTNQKEELSEVEEIFMAADRYLLNDLKERAFKFLERTCDINNITSRLFGQVAGLYPELDQIYSSYFKSNLLQIMGSEEYKTFFEELEESRDDRLKADINSKFRKLVQDQLHELTDDVGRAKRRKLE